MGTNLFELYPKACKAYSEFKLYGFRNSMMDLPTEESILLRLSGTENPKDFANPVLSKYIQTWHGAANWRDAGNVAKWNPALRKLTLFNKAGNVGVSRIREDEAEAIYVGQAPLARWEYLEDANACWEFMAEHLGYNLDKWESIL